VGKVYVRGTFNPCRLAILRTLARRPGFSWATVKEIAVGAGCASGSVYQAVGLLCGAGLISALFDDYPVRYRITAEGLRALAEGVTDAD